MEIPLILGPLNALFILATLFILDHYLSISTAFHPWKPPAGPAPVEGEPITSRTQARTTSSGRIEAVLYASAVLKIITVIVYPLAALWALSMLGAATDAILVAVLDSPFGSEWRDRTEFSFRAILGFGRAISDGSLAYSMGQIGILLWRSRKHMELESIVGDSGADSVGRQGSPSGGRTWFLGGFWAQRSNLDRNILLLLVSLFLSILCAIFVAYHFPFSHLKGVDPFWYFFVCSFTFLFAWSAALSLHSLRTSGISPRLRLGTFKYLVPFTLAVVWVLASSAYLVLWARGLFCRKEGDSPLPPDSPCRYIRASKIWTGAMSAVFGYAQAAILGAVGFTLRRASIGIRLPVGEEAGEQGISGSD